EQGPVRGAQIQILVIGDDLDTLSTISADIRSRISDVRGLVDLRDTMGGSSPRLVLDLDRRKAAVLGVDSFSFSRTVFMALNGETATHYRTEGEEIPVVVRLDRESIQEVSSLDAIYLPTHTGATVPFSEVASAREEPGFARIMHRDGRRSVTLEADVAGRLADETLADIQRSLADFALPEGYSLSYRGERQERAESFAGLGRAMAIALLLIYGLLAIQFNSFVQPVVILLTVPFGLTGAFFGLLITGNPFGFMAFIGVVSLTGIIINDSIVLTDFANYLQRVEGKRRFEALLEAGRMRFRPVILTSVTTIGGLTPLAIWGGTLWSPLACSVIFGLVGATVLILIVLPVIYALLVRPAEGRRQFRLLRAVRDRMLRAD
ncbi:MAG: efflux RND transporter permease subunit, partial [Planctomycetota bacterium]